MRAMRMLEGGGIVLLLALSFGLAAWGGPPSPPADYVSLQIQIDGTGTVTRDPAGIEFLGKFWYPPGTEVTLTAEPGEGFWFIEWTGDVADPTAPTTTILMDEDKVVTATFQRYWTLTVDVAPPGSGDVEVNGVTPDTYPATFDFLEGTTVDLTALPGDGWEFVNWTGDVADPNAAATTVLMDGNKTVTANFSAIEYTLEIITVGCGSVTKDPDKDTYNWWDVVELTAVPCEGYHFDQWAGALSGSANPATLQMNGDKTVVATFAINTYTIAVSADPPAGGTVTGGGTYTHGDSVTVTATPAECYEFVNWTEDDTVVSTDSTYTFTATSDRNLVAHFALIQYTVEVSADPPEGGTVTGGGTYDCGTSVTVTATPAPGYEFVNWTEDGTVVSTNSTYTFTIEADRNLVAHFQLAPETHTKELPAGWNLVSIPVTPMPAECPPEPCWAGALVTLTASSAADDTSDTAVFGVDPDATDCFDAAFDAPHAPTPPSPPYTEAWFELAPECGDTDRYTQDVKAPVPCGSSKTWTLKVRHNGTSSEITLSWTPITGGTACLGSVTLYDETAGTTVDMLSQTGYTFTVGSGTVTRSFTITVSCPCGGGEVFGDDVSPLALYRWNACTGAYQAAEDADVSPELGFWLKVPPGGATVDVTGYPVEEDVEIPLECAGWHMVSSPWTYDRGAILFRSGEETKTWDQAAAAGWIADVLWSYNPETGRYELVTAMDPWLGYWLLTYQDGLVMVLRFEEAGLGPASLLAPMAEPAAGPPEPPSPPFAAGGLTGANLDVANFPNPITDVHTTTFRVMGGQVEAIRISIYDLEGRLVYQAEAPGNELVWHTQNQLGEYLANGVYLYRAEAKVNGQWVVLGVKKLAIYR